MRTWGASPGFLATDLGASFAGMVGAPPVQSASVGGKLVASVLEGHRDMDVGKTVLKDGEVQPF